VVAQEKYAPAEREEAAEDSTCTGLADLQPCGMRRQLAAGGGSASASHSVVLPEPSCPLPLSPQHLTAAAVAPQVCEAPAEMLVNVLEPATTVGVRIRVLVAPLEPIWP
jgi:hypothetical protein